MRNFQEFEHLSHFDRYPADTLRKRPAPIVGAGLFLDPAQTQVVLGRTAHFLHTAGQLHRGAGLLWTKKGGQPHWRPPSSDRRVSPPQTRTILSLPPDLNSGLLGEAESAQNRLLSGDIGRRSLR